MQTLEEINNEYNSSSPLWLIMAKTVWSMPVATPILVLCIWWKCDKEYNQCVTRFQKKWLKECSTIGMMPIASATKATLNTRIKKPLEVKRYQPYSLSKVHEEDTWKCFPQSPVNNPVHCAFPRREERSITRH